MKVIKSETHERKIRAFLDRHELTRLISRHVAADAGVDLDDKAVRFTVEIREETAGSPSYHVGHGAAVEIIVDLTESVA